MMVSLIYCYCNHSMKAERSGLKNCLRRTIRELCVCPGIQCKNRTADRCNSLLTRTFTYYAKILTLLRKTLKRKIKVSFEESLFIQNFVNMIWMFQNIVLRIFGLTKICQQNIFGQKYFFIKNFFLKFKKIY